jgi:hypothetical protein
MSLCPAWIEIFQVIVARFPGEGVGEARAGSMKADGDRIRGDPEDRGHLLVPQFFPRDEAQELLVGGREGGQGGEGRSVAVLTGVQRRRYVVGAQECRQSLPSTVATAVVGEDASGDGVEPWKRLLGRDGPDLAPGDGERLGGDILSIREGLRAAHRVGKDVPLMLAEEHVETD